MCIRGREGEDDGVCTSFDVDSWCDGEGQAIGYGELGCWICGPLEARARACCDGLPGFDCRGWPYPSDGPPGAICARHLDCQPGLLCAAPANGSGYGICACPGVAPSQDPRCASLTEFR
jgi:hypothetical protein